MKRSSLLLFAVLASAFASAEVTSSNTLCWITVNSPYTNTIVSAALVDVGLPATNSIDVSNFILTNNLHVGDSLVKKVLSGTKWTWQGWAINEAGSWEAVTVTDGDHLFAAASDNALALANAFVLHRSRPAESNPIYISGQVESSASRTQTASQQVTFMANAGLTDIYINNIPWTTSPSNGDKLQLINENLTGGVVDYTWRSSKSGWCTNRIDTVTEDGITYKVTTAVKIEDNTVVLPVGQGFMFTRKSTETAAPSVTWSITGAL